MYTFRVPLDNIASVRAEHTRIGIGGDIVLGENAERALSDSNRLNWGPFHDWARSLDLLIITYDSGFPGHDFKAWKPHVLSGTNCLDNIPLGNKTLFNLANNHIFDGGIDGFFAASKAISQRGIAIIGAGVTRQDAEMPWIGQLNERYVKVFAAAHYGCHPSPLLPNGGQVAQLESRTWWNEVDTSIDGRSTIIVLLHGGIQGSHYPSPKAIELSNRLAEMGVNIVVWSHAHAIQGVLKTNRGFIAYGLGNLIHLPLHGDIHCPHANPAYDHGILLEFEPDPQTVHHGNVLFFRRDGLQVIPVSTKETRKWFLKLSQPLQKRTYPIWWIVYRFKQDVVERSIHYFKRDSLWKQLVNLRPKHIVSLISKISNARYDAEDV